MLVLSRKLNEKILLKKGNDEIIIKVTRIIGNRVTLGIKADPDVQIIRTELLEENENG